MRFAPFALAALLATVSASTDEGAGLLTLDDCLRLALSSHSAVSAARHQTGIAALGSTQARAALLPQSHLTGSFTYNSPLQGTGNVQSYVALNGIRECCGRS